MTPIRVAIALGSNLGAPRSHLDYGLARLRACLSDVRASRYIDTEPVGVGEQPMFVNAAAVATTTLSARELLTALLAIEAERGRVRPFPGAARTLDLDLVLYGEQRIEEPDLIVPHPRFRERAFVLEPLVEIAPDLIDPVTGRTVATLWNDFLTS